MPGPLSVTVTRKRVAWLAGGGVSPLLGATSSVTTTSGRMPASSAASSALSTASLTQVRSAFLGLSKPRRWRFLVKNSETEMSRWRAPISAAEMAAFGSGVGGLASAVAISFFDTRPTLAITPLYCYRARGSPDESARSPANALAVHGDAHEDERHLVRRALAPAHGARGFARLSPTLRGVVEHGDHVDARAARQRDGFRERVVRLPVEVPVVDVNQGAYGPVRVGRGHLHLAPEQMHVRRDAGRVHVAARGHGPRRLDFMPLLPRGNREGVVQDRDGAVPLVDRALREVQGDLRS